MPKGELLMRGSFNVIVQNNRVQFKLTISRNLTIIQGSSATGKQCYWVRPLLMKILDRKAV